MTPVRILVTGSRAWPESRRYVVEGAIDQALAHFSSIGVPVLVHGGCPTANFRRGSHVSVDEAADEYWRTLPLPLGEPEVHPANWSLGHQAGPARNAEMVRLGATVVLAFPTEKSRGTRDCMGKARAAGLTVWEFLPVEVAP